MKFGFLKCVGLGLALTISTAASAAKLPYDNLFVFGDSLTDSGNAYEFTGGAEASTTKGYVGGRFSNGYNFADYVSLTITGGPATAYKNAVPGSNFAVGGALAATYPGETSPSFANQIAYFDGSKQTIGANDLVLVNFGGNDLRQSITKPGPNYGANAVAGLTQGLSDLYDRGARNFVVIGIPDISDLPKTRAIVGALPVTDIVKAATLTQIKTASKNLNTAFDLASSQFGAAKADANVDFFDLFGFEEKVVANPTGYGLPAGFPKPGYCQKDGAAPCRGFLYFDDVHPTTQVHRAIGNAIATQLGAVPEPATWAMSIAGFGLIGGMARTRRRALAA